MGNKIEQEKHIPDFLHSNWWFGNGRRFGRQAGTIEQQLEDPYASCSDIVRRFWGTGQVPLGVPIWRIDHAIIRLTEKINSGTADINLIPTIEEIIKKAPVYRIADLLKHEESPRSIFRLYDIIISSAHTAECIPYLLQTLKDPFLIPASEFYDQSQTPLHGLIDGRIAYYPFAQRARVRIMEIYDQLPDSEKPSGVIEAIQEFDSYQPSNVTC